MVPAFVATIDDKVVCGTVLKSGIFRKRNNLDSNPFDQSYLFCWYLVYLEQRHKIVYGERETCVFPFSSISGRETCKRSLRTSGNDVTHFKLSLNIRISE